MAIAAPTTPFVWGQAGAMKTPEQIARDREIAAALMQEGMDYSPVGHWLQGAARAAQGGVGALKERWAGEAETAGRQGFQSRWDSVFGGGAPVQTASVDPVAAALTEQPGTALGAANDAGAPTAAGAAGVPQAVAQSDPMGLAATLIGKGEVPDRASIQEYLRNGGVNLDPATTAWCAAFVNATLGQAGIEGTGSNMARSFLNYGEAVDQPQRGDLAVFSRGDPNGPFGHVGFFDALNPDGTIRVLGGNQSDAVGYSNYGADQLLGYRRPPAGGAAVPTGGGSPSPLQMAQSPDMAALLGLAGDPWANDAQRRIVESLMGQQMQQQDPMYQLQMQAAQQGLTKGDLEIQQLLNPQIKPIEVNGRLVNPQTGEVIADYSDPNTATVGNAVIDVNTGLPIYEGQPDPTSNMQDYEAYAADEIASGRQPIGRLQYEQEVRKAGASNISVGGVSQTPGDDKFYETLGTESGKRFSAMIQQGSAARRNLSQLDVASDLLQTAPQGPRGLATLFAGRLGIDLGGLDEAQALNAVVNQMIPAQREPGSGPMSDRDIDMYKGSVVAVSNLPGGNALIIETARAVNQYDMQIADIAGKVEDGLLTRAEAREEMANVPNPIDAFREARKRLEEGGGATPPSATAPAAPNQSQVPTVSTEEQYNALPPGAPYKAPDGSMRIKGNG